MPYIKQNDRDHVDYQISRLAERGDGHPGTLNYIITRLVVFWLGATPNYEKYNAAIGVLECAKQELYRKQISNYEDKKCKENGNVYTLKRTPDDWNPPV